MIKVDAKYKRDGRTYLSIHWPGKIPFHVGQLVGFVHENERSEYRVLGWQRQNKTFNGPDGHPLRGDSVIIWVES